MAHRDDGPAVALARTASPRPRRDVDADAAEHGRLGDRDRQAAVGHVVGAAEQARSAARRRAARAGGARRRGRAPGGARRRRRRSPAGSSSRRARAGRRRRAARRRRSRGSRRRRAQLGVVEQPDHADDRRRVDRPAVGLVVEGDVAAHDRQAERLGTPRPCPRSPRASCVADLGFSGLPKLRQSVTATARRRRTRRCGRPRRPRSRRRGAGRAHAPAVAVERDGDRALATASARTTAASPPGPRRCRADQWSYWRYTQRRLRDVRASRAARSSARVAGRPPSLGRAARREAGRALAARARSAGTSSVSGATGSSPTELPPSKHAHAPSSVTSPITVACTSHARRSPRPRLGQRRLDDRSIRSCDSEIITSNGFIPGSRRGTRRDVDVDARRRRAPPSRPSTTSARPRPGPAAPRRWPPLEQLEARLDQLLPGNGSPTCTLGRLASSSSSNPATRARWRRRCRRGPCATPNSSTGLPGPPARAARQPVGAAARPTHIALTSGLRA